jgi:predicted ATPase
MAQPLAAETATDQVVSRNVAWSIYEALVESLGNQPHSRRLLKIVSPRCRDLLPRQQTLRALIDWSHDLLTEREQLMFRRLGIFVNGFTLEAAAAVAGGDELDEFAVLDLIASLVEKSLVITEAQGESVRYRLLESTRATADVHTFPFPDQFCVLRQGRVSGRILSPKAA